MIISHRYRFVFIKTRKTAGSSLEIALSKYCGPRDIISSISEEEDRERTALGYRGPQHDTIPLRHHTRHELLRMLQSGRLDRRVYHRHMKAKDVRSRVAGHVWANYFKFCIERNPWDKAISLYYWRTRNQRERPPLIDYLQSEESKDLSNWDIYTQNDRVLVDHVARYENLEAELRAIAARLGIPGDLAADLRGINAKGGVRVDRRRYQEVIGTDERQVIARICANEITQFGYSF
ncbi:MAG: sulfotransferase family 2 domain-containing protein [Gammaproteobacteria bacterium]|nr:sulfotransferase family 2 domain-containing protein [Gammaproteobacteria bacterium]